MENMSKVLIFILSFNIIKTQGSVPKTFNDIMNYFSLKQSSSKPAFQFIDNSEYNEISDNYIYAFISSKKDDYRAFIDKNMNLKDYVFIKAKAQPFELGPYELIQKLDEIKYMILWLNLYCSMHPDCDKKELNKELKNVSIILFYNYQTHYPNKSFN